MFSLLSLQESAEHYNRTLSERIQEIEEMRRQLCTRQQQLASAEKLSSTATQEGYLETAKLRALLTEKESIIIVSLDRVFWIGAEYTTILCF